MWYINITIPSLPSSVTNLEYHITFFINLVHSSEETSFLTTFYCLFFSHHYTHITHYKSYWTFCVGSYSYQCASWGLTFSLFLKNMGQIHRIYYINRAYIIFSHFSYFITFSSILSNIFYAPLSAYLGRPRYKGTRY